MAVGEAEIAAIGRLTWSAMKLEAWMNRMCETLAPESTAKGTIGPHVTRAKEALPEPDSAEAAAIAWLDEALAELDSRNSVMHGRVTAHYFGDTPAPTDRWQWELQIWDERRKRSIPFTVASLDELTGRLDGILQAGIPVDVALAMRAYTQPITE